MNERNFQLFLEENEVGTNIIENFLSKLRDYEILLTPKMIMSSVQIRLAIPLSHQLILNL